MAAERENDMQCNEFDALLSDALDRILTGDKLERFQAHAGACSICGPLLTEAEQGQRWLKQLGEVDPPANLVQNILVSTSGVDTVRLRGSAAVQAEVGLFDRLRDWASLLASPVVAAVRQPRFVMSFGMAFFSLSISLSLAGVKLNDVRHADLRPSSIKRACYEEKCQLWAPTYPQFCTCSIAVIPAALKQLESILTLQTKNKMESSSASRKSA